MIQVEKTAINCFLYELKKLNQYAYVLANFDCSIMSNISYPIPLKEKRYGYRINRDEYDDCGAKLIKCKNISEIEKYFVNKNGGPLNDDSQKNEIIDRATKTINNLLHNFLERLVGFPQICKVGQDIFNRTMSQLGIEVPEEENQGKPDINQIIHNSALKSLNINDFVKSVKRSVDRNKLNEEFKIEDYISQLMDANNGIRTSNATDLYWQL